MKFLVIFAFALASASAEIYQRNVVVPVLENEGRITNGNIAKVGQFPYQVGLLLKKNFILGSWCGGSLIANEYVLTAAHCVDRIPSITVYLGATERTSPEITLTVSKDNVVIHPGWNSKTVMNDIALIKIPAVDYSANIQPVQLPAISNSYSNYDGDYVIASGWGLISDSESAVANDLRYAIMQVISNSKCARTYGQTITDSKLCVATTGGVSTCNGDSGGPIVLESTGVQIGLTSFGAKAGCTLGHPAAFTRLTSFLDWIESITGDSY